MARSEAGQPWRALKRGLVLLMTKTRPLRRIMRQSLCRFLADFNELTTFMAGLGRLLGAAEGGTYGSPPGLSMPGRPRAADAAIWMPTANGVRSCLFVGRDGPRFL